jgi:hypothetical protein
MQDQPHSRRPWRRCSGWCGRRWRSSRATDSL